MKHDSPHNVRSPAERARSRGDWLAMGLILLVAWLVRGAWLDWPAFNPDESIYAARASFLLGEGDSAFTRPIGVEHTVELYRLMGRVFGPYCLFEIRTLILLISATVAGAVYWLVRREAQWPTALTAAGVFLYYNLYFEGLSANREWFALLGIMLSAVLFLAAEDRPVRTALILLMMSGLAAGSAVWFKHQAVPLLLPIAVVLVCGMGVPRSTRPRLHDLAAYLAGLSLAAALYLAPFLAAGTLREHLHFILDFRMRYAFDQDGGTITQSGTAGWLRFWYLFYQAVPLHRICLMAYASAVFFAVTSLFHRWRGDRHAKSTTPVLFALYLLAALVAIQMGGRYFAHYFLFLVPVVAVLFGLAIDLIVRLLRNPLTGPWWLATLALLMITDVLFVPATAPVEQFEFADSPLGVSAAGERLAAVPSFPTMSAALLVGFVVFSAIAWAARTRPRFKSVTKAGFAALVVVIGGIDLGWLVAKVHLYPSAVARAADEQPACAALLNYLTTTAVASDRILVWGLYPEIYTYSRLEAASQLVTAVLVLGDVRGMTAGPPRIDAYYSGLLIDDLQRKPPRFILDAAPRSIHAEFYALDHFPPLVEILHQNYKLVATRDGIDVYQWTGNHRR